MKVFVYDLDKCNGCHNCQIACKDEHVENDWMPYAKPQPDTGQFWCKVEEEVCGKTPHVKVNYLPVQCNHCDDAPCMKGHDAIYKRDDGLVIIDPEKAKGDKGIVDSCPYGVIYWNEELEIPQKCTGCAHLLDDGWDAPRCVDACCTGALRFGEEEDFADELKDAVVLKPELGTAPRVYYLNKPKRFVAATVVDIDADEIVERAEVLLQRVSDEEVVAVSQTDEFGDVWIENIEPDSYRMWLKKDGYLDQAVDVDLTEKDQAFPELQFFKAPVCA
ncbi:MAG: oxidoreductase [Eggerthellaceae bacterium]|nr:oxidoreductase [Eggerthellaceae bacterium]